MKQMIILCDAETKKMSLNVDGMTVEGVRYINAGIYRDDEEDELEVSFEVAKELPNGDKMSTRYYSCSKKCKETEKASVAVASTDYPGFYNAEPVEQPQHDVSEDLDKYLNGRRART